eukprot:2510495-Rhodomonas_salina.1
MQAWRHGRERTARLRLWVSLSHFTSSSELGQTQRAAHLRLPAVNSRCPSHCARQCERVMCVLTHAWSLRQRRWCGAPSTIAHRLTDGVGGRVRRAS